MMKAWVLVLLAVVFDLPEFLNYRRIDRFPMDDMCAHAIEAFVLHPRFLNINTLTNPQSAPALAPDQQYHRFYPVNVPVHRDCSSETAIDWSS